MKSKKTTAVAVLSQKDLNDEGIKTQLTQNDVLEIIVEEKYKEFEETLKNFQEQPKQFIADFQNVIKEHYVSQLDKFIKKHKIPFTKEQVLGFGIRVYTVVERKGQNPYISHLEAYSGNISHLCTSNTGTLTIGKAVQYRNGKKTILGLEKYSSFPAKITSELSIKVNFDHTESEDTIVSETAEFKISNRKSYFFSMKFDLKDVKGISKVLADVQKYEKESEAFIEKYKDMDVSYENILRQVKTTFNKELIKTGSPKLRQKIKESFGITI